MRDESETRTVEVEVDGELKHWLDVTAREYDASTKEAAGELLRYGLVNHEAAMGD